MLPANTSLHPHLLGRVGAVLQFNGPTDTLGTEPGRLMAAKRKAPAPKAAEDGRQIVRINHGSTGLNLPEEKQEAIARMHIAGVPVTRIAGELGVSYHSVAALIRNRPELLSAARDITAANWKTLAALGTAQLVDRLPEMKDQALSVLSAIATEKAELLQGNATQRIEVVAAPAADEWHDVVDGVVIESAPLPMGNTGRTRAAKGKATPANLLTDSASGEQPPVIGPRYSDATDIVPEFEPTGPGFLPPPPPTDRGGVGDRRSSRPSLPDSLSDEKIFG